MISNVDLDFHLRQALARWQAKNDYLLEKWNKRLKECVSDDCLLISEIVEDLKLPIDLVLSEFDMKGCK